MVHLDASDLPLDYALVTIDIPDDVPSMRVSAEQALAVSTNPPVPVFVVPSVVVPQEFNVVLYPQAAGFRARIARLEPFHFDERLLGYGRNK